MKNFMLFVYTDFEASGGMNDFWQDFDTLESAQGYLFHYICHYTGDDSHYGYLINHSAHVYSLSEGKIVAETYAYETEPQQWGWKLK